jgi:hypothetical protein
MKNPDPETVRPEYFCHESAAGMPKLDLNLIINKRFEAFDELPPAFFYGRLIFYDFQHHPLPVRSGCHVCLLMDEICRTFT